MAAEEKDLSFALEADQLSEIVGLLRTLVEETAWQFTKDGLRVVAVDTSHVSEVILKVPPEAFPVWKVPEDRDVGVDLNKMRDVVKLIPEEERGTIIIRIDVRVRADGLKLVAVFPDGLVRTMSTYDLSGHIYPKVPVYDPPSVSEVEVRRLRRAVQAAEAITDQCVLTASPHSELLDFIAEGETERVEQDIPATPIRLPEKQVRSCFPLDYLSTVVKAIRAVKVRVGLGDEYPLRLSFNLAEGPGSCEFLLAPRIESD